MAAAAVAAVRENSLLPLPAGTRSHAHPVVMLISVAAMSSAGMRSRSLAACTTSCQKTSLGAAATLPQALLSIVYHSVSRECRNKLSLLPFHCHNQLVVLHCLCPAGTRSLSPAACTTGCQQTSNASHRNLCQHSRDSASPLPAGTRSRSPAVCTTGCQQTSPGAATIGVISFKLKSAHFCIAPACRNESRCCRFNAMTSHLCCCHVLCRNEITLTGCVHNRLSADQPWSCPRNRTGYLQSDPTAAWGTKFHTKVNCQEECTLHNFFKGNIALYVCYVM
jgi:hypothetical protein